MIWEGLKELPGFTGAITLSHDPKDRRMNRIWNFLFSLNFEKSFFRSFVKLLLIWNPVWTLILSFLYEGDSPRSVFFRWGWSFFEATIVGLFAMLMIWLYLAGERRWREHHQKNRIIHGTGWYLLFMGFMVPPGLFLAIRLIFWLINVTFAGEPLTPEFHWEFYGNEIFWGWILLLVFFFLKSWGELREMTRWSQLRAEELEKERLQAMLTKLKDQMNPHFLFNTLNTVASLIPVDPSKAEQVVIKLSSLFQAILEATRKTRHSLKTELEFCENYLDIEKIRFGSRITTQIKIDSSVDTESFQVPVLILQPLVENAVKHGISSRASGGKVGIEALTRDQNLILSVVDDGVGFGNSPYAGSGTALENCRKRLELEFGNQGRMEIVNRKEGGVKIILTMAIVELAVGEKRGS